MDSLLFWLIPAASVLALCFAYYFHKQMMKESEGTPQMIKIAASCFLPYRRALFGVDG